MGGTLVTVADANTAIPGGTGNFTNFSQPWLWDGTVVFRGIGEGAFVGIGVGDQDGIYAYDGTTLRVVADSNTPIPGPIGNFVSFGIVHHLSPSGIPDRVAGVPAFDDGIVVFQGRGVEGCDYYGIGCHTGVYMESEGVISVVADTNTPRPGYPGTFSQFNDSVLAASVCNGMIAFHGGRGIYIWEDGEIRIGVDLNTIVPGDDRSFTGFGFQGYGLDRGAISFLAGNGSIYSTVGGTLRRAVFSHGLNDVGTIIEGREVASMGTYGRSLEGDYLGFNVGNWADTEGNFGDTIENVVTAIFVATFPSVTSQCTVDANGVVQCNLEGSLAPGESTTVTITGKTSTVGNVTTSVAVSSALADPDASDNSTDVTTTVTEAAMLYARIVTEVDAPVAGEAFAYSLAAGNLLGSPASNVVVEYQVPTGLTPSCQRPPNVRSAGPGSSPVRSALSWRVR